jgi:hypothetical protein
VSETTESRRSIHARIRRSFDRTGHLRSNRGQPLPWSSLLVIDARGDARGGASAITERLVGFGRRPA